MTDTAVPPQAPKAAFWEDVLEIFYAPGKVFARRDGSNVVLPLLVLVVLTAVLFFATQSLLAPAFDAETARQIQSALAKNPQMTREQAQRGMEIGRRFAGVGVILATLILPLLVGVVLWVVGKLFSSTALLGAAVMVAVFSYYPRLLSWIVMAVQAAVLPPERIRGLADVGLSLARFADPNHTSAGMMALLGRFDLFIIWSTVLLGLGLKIKGKLTSGQAAAAAVIMFLLGSFPVLIAFARG